MPWGGGHFCNRKKKCCVSVNNILKGSRNLKEECGEGKDGAQSNA